MQDAPDEDFAVWPENWDAVRVFVACATQWRIAAGMRVVRTGLDYTAVEAVMRLLGIPRAARADALYGIQVLESECLSIWAAR